MAAEIKESGATIFSVGVDIGGQTVQTYVDQTEGESYTYSVVDRTSESYEIGSATSADAYKNWLRTSIGSGYYYDSTDTAGLTSAFGEILEEIKVQVATNARADWVASDPLPTISGAAGAVEFIGFYDKTPNLISGNLTGTNEPNGENTAKYDNGEQQISWDLKNSGYTTTVSGSTTTYTYRLVYRVRLKNENSDFVEEKVYPTNDTTTLTYRIIETVNGVPKVSAQKTLEFPIPSVKGYLAELSFDKVDSFGKPLSGAVFTLTHDTTQCSICHGDGTSTSVESVTQTSDSDGKVTFTNVPSGHIYTLVETEVPDGYRDDHATYRVTVAYDEITVTRADGTAADWNGKIVNHNLYELPESGGMGTLPYTAGGAALILAAVVGLMYHKKRRREARKPS